MAEEKLGRVTNTAVKLIYWLSAALMGTQTWLNRRKEPFGHLCLDSQDFCPTLILLHLRISFLCDHVA